MRSMRRGFTLLEVIIAVSILGIFAALGLGTMQEHLSRFRLVRTAKQFRADMVMMRQIAVQTNRESRMLLLSHSGDCTDGTSWGGAWQLAVGNRSLGASQWDLLPEDSLIDGVDDDQSQALVDISAFGDERGYDICFRQWPSILGPSIGGNNQDAIIFGPRGWLRNPSSDFNARGYLEFIFVNQEANREGILDSLKVQVSRSGMIRLVRVPQSYHSNPVGTSTSSSVQ